jgi:uncharacterized zinc-type alcohol dehydrogenase-like protein
MKTKNIKAYGTEAANAPLHSMSIKRRELLPRDVELEILYCGICHSDLHQIRNEFGGATFPIVPGHEIDLVPNIHRLCENSRNGRRRALG